MCLTSLFTDISNSLIGDSPSTMEKKHKRIDAKAGMASKPLHDAVSPGSDVNPLVTLNKTISDDLAKRAVRTLNGTEPSLALTPPPEQQLLGFSAELQL